MSDRLSRVRGILGFAVRRTLARLRGADRTQILLSIGGVAIAVALLLLVTSVGVGLSASETVRASNADYAIMPVGGSSAVTDVGRAKLGRAHEVTSSLSARDDIDYATAIRSTTLRVRVAGGNASQEESTRLLIIGVTSTREDGVIAGLPTKGLSREDVHYADGAYNGSFTGEAVLSESAADRLNATEGAELRPIQSGGNRTFQVAAINEPRRGGLGQFPVALVHLSELQTVINATDGDAADQILVEANDPAVEEYLGEVYPETTVVSRSDLFAGSDGRSRLPVAIAIAAFVVSLVVGTLFMITTMGFELAADRENRAVMRAIGLSGRSRTAVVVVQTFVVAVCGGVGGIGLWLVGIGVGNALSETVSSVPVAVFRPVLAAYGLGVALLIGLLTVPYLLVAARRGSMSEVTL
ncbi:MAG: FtsX-like permease family protein [Halobacteriales archaeon]